VHPLSGIGFTYKERNTHILVRADPSGMNIRWGDEISNNYPPPSTQKTLAQVGDEKKVIKIG